MAPAGGDTGHLSSMPSPQHIPLILPGLELVHVPSPRLGALSPKPIDVCLIPEFSGPAQRDSTAVGQSTRLTLCHTWHSDFID